MLKRSILYPMATILSCLLMMVPVAPAVASAGSPTGVNIGFAIDIDNSGTSPVGSSASLIDDGSSLDNCGGDDLSAVSFSGCSFFYETEVNGLVTDSFFDLANQPYGSTTTYDVEADDSLCNPIITEFMLTNFNCSNENSFGQIFRPVAGGNLTNFKMALSCLAPGTISFYAVLYKLQHDDASSSISGEPLGNFKITLDGCSTTWQNKTFTQSDFEVVNMDFGAPLLTAGDSYGVYFAGEFVPGTQIVDVETLDSFVPDSPVGEATPYNGPEIYGNASKQVLPGLSASFSGNRLNSINKIEIAGTTCKFEVIGDVIKIEVPKKLASGLHDIIAYSDFGKLTVQDAFTVTASSVELEDSALSLALYSWTKKLSDSTVKIYAKNVVGVGKIQFILNGKEIAWVNADSARDSKLRTANGAHYLVRTVELIKGQKNILEVHVDGVRIKRAAYSY